MQVMTIEEHSRQVVDGLERMADIFGEFASKVTQTQETHDMVIKLEGRMLNVERSLDRIVKQLDDLPNRLDCTYAKKGDLDTNKDKINDVEKRLKGFENWLIFFALSILVAGALISLDIADKVHF